MRNMLAIAHKEIRGYFASPIAWVTVGFFALLVGGFYITSLAFFLQRSMQFDSCSPRWVSRRNRSTSTSG